MPRPTPGRDVPGESSGRREATAPTASNDGAAVLPTLRASVTRSCQDTSPLAEAARQVSTATPARSSSWSESVERCRCVSLRAQRPSRSQLDVVPSAERPRSRTSTKLLPGVRADHDGITSLNANPGVTHGESHRACS